MASLPDLIQTGGHAWLFLPSAFFLGALHGLEPGHSKTVLTSFIIAVRGTITQAVLLGLSATVSHTLIVWILVGVGMILGRQWYNEASEPYFQLASAVLVVLIALWMLWRTYRERHHAANHSHSQEKHGPHGGTLISTGHGTVEISVFETGVPPIFRLYFFGSSMKPIAPEDAKAVGIETLREGGGRQAFSFLRKEDFLESTTDIPEPHEFKLTMTIGHGGHHHSFTTQFTEEHHHHAIDAGSPDFEDAHQRAHAQEIERRFTSKNVTTGQIILFGLTGGLLPCSAAITVLLLCLQTHRLLLGFLLVGGFSLGLGATMVATGVVAAWGMKHVSAKFGGAAGLMKKAPYFSSALIICLGLYLGIHAWIQLP